MLAALVLATLLCATRATLTLRFTPPVLDTETGPQTTALELQYALGADTLTQCRVFAVGPAGTCDIDSVAGAWIYK